MSEHETHAEHLGDGAYVSALEGAYVVTANHHDVNIASEQVWLYSAAAQALVDWFAARGITARGTDDHGFTAAPARYTQQGRETIDRMRDLCRSLADTPEGGDHLFVVHCHATALKYLDRAGAKGDPGGDARKACWYMVMAHHVMGAGPDPRAERPGFKPYSPEPFDAELVRGVVP